MQDNLAYWEKAREELLGGVPVAMSPSPAWNHIAVSGDIYRIFANYLHEKDCVAIPDGFDLYLTETERFIPDMMVVCDREKIQKNGVHGSPDLVVEVLSPSTAHNDRGHKMAVYSACGVREYWIVSPRERMVEQYLQEEGRLVLHAVHAYEPDDGPAPSFRCSLYADLPISLADIFHRTI